MKVALSLGYAQAKMSLPIPLIQRAEAAGFDLVTCAETYSSDAFTPLAFIGAHTKKIKLGTSIAILAARSPANLAMCAQTIDAMCGEGRMVVGLGTSGPQIVEGWYGQPWGRPNYRLRDYVAIVKKVFRREGPVSHEGKEISLPYRGEGSSGLGKPLKSILHGNPDIPVLLGTETELNIRMTGEVADGWICMNWIPGKTADANRKLIEEGLARRTDGRTLKDFIIHTIAEVRITDDVKAGIEASKPGIALYVGGMGAKEKNFHVQKMIRRGFPEAAQRIQELYLSGRKDEAAAAVPDEFVDEGALIGPPDRIKQRFRAFADSGLTRLSIQRANEDVIDLIGRIAAG
ncbi:MAG: LLM class F420-dependent oxidoreductase [Gammaproteobacteria bacterium]